MATDQAAATTMIDNDKVRVTEWRFGPGQQTGQHRHEMAYIVVPVTTGRLLNQNPEGDVYREMTAGSPYFRDAGLEHNVVNTNDFEFAFIEIEIK